MSHPIPSTLYRIGAVAGCGTAVILLINAAKRAEVIPTSAFTQLVAPLAQILALALDHRPLLRLRTPGRHLRPRRLPAERVRPRGTGRRRVRDQPRLRRDLPDDTVETLRAGSLGIALTVASITFLLGTLAFVTAMLRTRQVPAAPLVLYAVGAVPGLATRLRPGRGAEPRSPVLAIGAGWLSIWLFNRSERIATWTIAATPSADRVAA